MVYVIFLLILTLVLPAFSDFQTCFFVFLWHHGDLRAWTLLVQTCSQRSQSQSTWALCRLAVNVLFWPVNFSIGHVHFFPLWLDLSTVNFGRWLGRKGLISLCQVETVYPAISCLLTLLWEQFFQTKCLSKSLRSYKCCISATSLPPCQLQFFSFLILAYQSLIPAYDSRDNLNKCLTYIYFYNCGHLW